MNPGSATMQHHRLTQWLTLFLALTLVLSSLLVKAEQLDIADVPLYLSASAKPIVMLNASKDHQLYFKAFDDYSDLDNDGIPETTYKHSFDYYGYFDSYKCYNYNTTTKLFEPNAITSTKYCSSSWSGNFLNWASMTRIDTIRKILYGGLRLTDLGAQTSNTSVTTPPVTSEPIPSGPSTSPSSYVLDSTVLTSDTKSKSVNGTNMLCKNLPIIGTESTSPESFPPSSTVPGPTTDSPSTDSTPINSTPVTTTTVTAAGTTTTSTFNTTFNSSFTRTSSTQYTTTFTKTHTETIKNKTLSDGFCSTKVTVYTKTYTNTYISGYTTPYQLTTTTTTTTTNQPTPGVTVLERTYLPNDAHSFAKFYKGSDLTQLTPFSSSDVTNGITLCNTTVSNTVLSQNVTDPPLIRVAKGNFSLWAANERWQCRWSEEKSASNRDSGTADPGLGAGASNPSKSSTGLGSKDYVARLNVCDTDFIGTENCKIYPDKTRKPIGLLQTYGDDDKLRFGLMTGSFGKNKSGGVLRKNVSSMTDEINVDTNGTFKTVPAGGGIINTLNKLRIYGYRHDDGTFFGVTGSDNCTWGLNSFTDGKCSNWGNPQSEILLESLRYIANKTTSSTFATNDTSYIAGLTTATAVNPMISSEYCASLNVIQFNASSSSYDADQLGGVTDLGASDINALTDTVGTGESITGNKFFVGENGTDLNQLCTAKTVSNLSSVRGTCPDAPRLSGSYQMAGLAHYAHTNDIQSSLKGDQLVTTYGVALSPAVPKISIPVPTSTTKKITLLPACQDSSVGGNCAIVDFKIIHQDCTLLSSSEKLSSGTQNCGKLYVNWEDSEQGGDFDQDQWGVLTYSVNSTQIKITTDVIAKSTPYEMGFGYILSGTNKDGFHTHSGINGYDYSDPLGTTGCSNCNHSDAATSVTYTLGTSDAASLEQPLFYAAKWGGFNDFDNSDTPNKTSEWDANKNGIPDRYFFAIDPKKLETSLHDAFDDVLKKTASSSAAAANSTSLQTGTVLYQAQFSSVDWSGHLYSFPVSADGTIKNINDDKDSNGKDILNCLDAIWCAEEGIPAAASRNIKTINGGAGIDFLWNNLSDNQKTALKTGSDDVIGDESLGQARLNWLRGDTSNPNDIFRERPLTILEDRINILGDIINSDPIYVHTEDYGYASTAFTGSEQSSYAAFIAAKKNNPNRPPMVYDGANDGMLHGFRADSLNADSGQELLAYIPNAVFGKLSSLTDPYYVHQFFVDGSPTVGDAYLDPEWKTVLLGGLGKGGKAIYALNISSPKIFVDADVLWEYSGSTDPTTADDGTNTTDVDGMGFTYSQPQIAKLNNGDWAAIFGNGYNSTSERAFLYIVNLSTGALIKKIPTNTSTSNGLSTPKLYDSNGDMIIDYAYAGDLQGNMWKFNLSATDSTAWGISNGGNPLFIARNDNNKVQPITSQPALGNNTNGILVYFGTGRYLTAGDVSDGTIQSFYAILDKSSSSTVSRGSLVQQTITASDVIYTIPDCTDNPLTTENECQIPYELRTTSANSVDFSNKNGWYMDFDVSTGERIISSPQLKYDRVIFLTAIPSDDPCNPGGESWLMELDNMTGGRTGTSSFDFNNDDKFDEKDLLPNTQTASGIKSTVGMVKQAVWLDKDGTGIAVKEMSGTTSNIMTLKNKGGNVVNGSVRKLYWLQIQ